MMIKLHLFHLLHYNILHTYYINSACTYDHHNNSMLCLYLQDVLCKTPYELVKCLGLGYPTVTELQLEVSRACAPESVSVSNNNNNIQNLYIALYNLSAKRLL